MRILTLLLSVLLSLGSVAAEVPLNVGDAAPDWSLENNNGESVNYHEDSKENISMIFFWAAGCRYCTSLMPHLEVIYRKYRSKGLKFYAINAFEDGKIDPVEFFENNEYTFTMLENGDSVAEQYGIRRLPGLYVIDGGKKIIYRRPAGVSDVLVIQNVDLKIKQAIAR